MAKAAKSKKRNSPRASSSPQSVRARQEAARAKAARARRNQNLLVGGALMLFLLIIAGIVFVNLRGRAPVDGEEVFRSQGNTHIDFGRRAPIEYNSVPPSSGPHYGNLAAWQVYEEPIRYEQLIHNLEDGGVVLYYQCEEACPELVEQLTDLAQPFIDGGRHVIVVPNDPTFSINDGPPLHQDMGAKIAAVAWGRVLKFDEFDKDALRIFIERYEGIDHHVRG